MGLTGITHPGKVASDTQTYDKEEVEYARKGAVADLMARNDYASCGLLLLGDNVGDDLSLNPDLRELYENANGPIRALPGNHDMDYDAEGDDHALDTYRQAFGAPYYSYDVGETHFACPVCGDVVREVSFADRSLQYCATCQTGGAVLADRRTSRFVR